MVIEATYTGAHGSMGYQRGQRYVLLVQNRDGMDVQREDGTGKCPYGSLSAFLHSWTDISVISRPVTEADLRNPPT